MVRSQTTCFAFKTALLFCLVLSLTGLGQAQFDDAAAKTIFNLVNQERESRGLNALKWSDGLAKAARAHTRLLKENKALSHRFSGEPELMNRLSATGVRFNESGENVALNIDPVGAHNALMHSPGHRANILKPEFSDVGIAVLHDGDQIWVTQDFARTFDEVSIQEAEMRIAAAFNSLRQASGAFTVKYYSDAEARKDACAMAANNRVKAEAPRTASGIANVVAFTTTDLDKVPSSLAALKRTPLSSMRVGACFKTSASYPTPVYWFEVLLLR